MKLKLTPSRLPSLIALKTFEAAARYSSFTGAAQELNVTLGAVSRQIGRLEHQLGIPLFTRKGNAVALNETGRQLSADVSQAFALLKSATDRVRPMEVTSLKLTCTMGIGSHWLAHRLPMMQKMTQPLNLIIDASENVRDLATGEADIALRYCPKVSVPPHSRLLLSDGFLPMIAPALLAQCGPVLSVDDLLSMRLIDAPWSGKQGTGIPSWHQWFATFGQLSSPPRQVVSYNSVGQALQEAIDGKGVVLGSRAVATDALNNQQLSPVFGAHYQLPADHEFRVVWPQAMISDTLKYWINLLLLAAGQPPLE